MFHSYMYAVLAIDLSAQQYNQQMSELPFMTVIQNLSLLKPCYERYFAYLLDACFKSLHHCSIDVLARYSMHW